MPFIIEINKLNNRLEDIKEKVNEGMLYIFAQLEVEKLLEEAQPKYDLWSNLPNIDEEILVELKTVIKQANQFLNDITDMIEIEKTKCL